MKHFYSTRDINFCLKHDDSSWGIRDSLTEGPSLVGPSGKERSLLYVPSPPWTRPSELHALIKFTTQVTLHIKFLLDSVDHWGSQLRLWELVDNVRYLMHAMGQVKRRRKLTVKFTLERKSEKKLQPLQTKILQVLEQLHDDIELMVLFVRHDRFENVVETRDGQDIGEKTRYLALLQDTRRSQHFLAHRERLDEDWYRLRAWVHGVFVFTPEWLPSSNTRYAAVNGESGNVLRDCLTRSWNGQHAGDRNEFEAAKRTIAKMWEDQHEKYKQAYLEL